MTSFQIDRAETAEHMSDAVTYLQREALRAGLDGIAAELAIIAHRLKNLALKEKPIDAAGAQGPARKH